MRDAAVHAAVCDDIAAFLAVARIGASAASCRRRLSAATATANSSSRPNVVERLTIDRIGHRGDGMAIGPDGADLRSRHPAGRDRRSRSRSRPSGPATASSTSISRARSALRRSARISASAAAAPCSTGNAEPIAPGNAVWSSRRCARPASTRAVGELIDAHGEGRRRAVFHARRGTHDVLEVGFSAARAHRVIAIDRCPVLAKSLDGALKAAWAIAEALDADAQSRSTSR